MANTRLLEGQLAIKQENAMLRIFGKQFSNEEVQKSRGIEITYSSMEDPGGDYTKLRLVGFNGETIAERTIAGY